MNMKSRRIIAISLILLGALLMLLTPDQTTGGLLIIAIGVIIEIAGITLERRG
jgi:hypothetical protein